MHALRYTRSLFFARAARNTNTSSFFFSRLWYACRADKSAGEDDDDIAADDDEKKAWRGKEEKRTGPRGSLINRSDADKSRERVRCLRTTYRLSVSFYFFPQLLLSLVIIVIDFTLINDLKRK
jgi:hypothetical protein